MKIIGSPRIVSHESSHPGLSQAEGCGDIATKQLDDNGTCFCLYTGSRKTGMEFFPFNVPDPDDTEDEEELKKQLKHLHKRGSPLPDAQLNRFGSTQLGWGASFVSVGSILYCIGGDINTCGNEVKKFDTKISEFEVDPIVMPPPMIRARRFPAVVAIGKIIYVFGGQNPEATQDNSSWAECLNTDMPIAMQKWMPLSQPPFLIQLSFTSFAIPYGNDSILIADNKISRGALLYNFRDGIWMKYEFPYYICHVRKPVSLLCDKTVYWIEYWVESMCMFAYDYDKNVLYRGLMRHLLSERTFSSSPLLGPYLMHLKDDIFGCFTLHYVYDRAGTSQTELVQCTTFQVTKLSFEYGRGELRLRAMGYKSYKSGKIRSLLGVVPIYDEPLSFKCYKMHKVNF